MSKSNRISTLWLAVGLFGTILGCTSSPQTPPPPSIGRGQLAAATAWLRMTIATEMKSHQIPGLSIVVVDSHGLLWSAGFGLANIAAGTPFTAGTISNVGAVSKTITAAAVMKLVEAGKIDLDQPYATYVPDFKPPASAIDPAGVTVRSLLNHHSGLISDSLYEWSFGDQPPINYPRILEQALSAANALPLVTPANTIFGYSNLGFSLLGLLVERVSGQSFNDFVTKELLEPMGLRDSSFVMPPTKRARYAMGYSQGQAAFIPYVRDLPALAFNTSANDLGQYLSSLLAAWRGEQSVLSQTLVKALFLPSSDELPLDFGFQIGLGWWLLDDADLPGESVVWQGGDLPPYHATVLLLPDRDLAVAIMVNGGTSYLPTILTGAIRAFSQVLGQKPIAQPIADAATLPDRFPPELATSLTGYYVSQNGLSQVKSAGGVMSASLLGPWLDLEYHANGRLSFGYKLLGLFPVDLPGASDLTITPRQLNGQSWLLLAKRGASGNPFLKVQPVPIRAAWIARSGDYEQVNTEAFPVFSRFSLGMDKDSGFYCLSVGSPSGMVKFPLTTPSADRATVMGWGRNLGQTILVQSTAAGECLAFAGLILKRR
jgi:CubicO group peptidase (beta-lactamase class C family)